MIGGVEPHGAAASDIGSIPGWYGKLPTLGDFASRRLEADFIEPWDLWLGECLQGLRDSLGEAWLQAYLHSPPWRFLLMPGTLAGIDRRRVLAGVLMPSVDRVGRYFPLTLAAALPGVPSASGEIAAVLGWMQRLEDTGLDALHGDWSIEALESALVGLAPPGRNGDLAAEDPLATARREIQAALSAGGGSVELAPAVSRQDLASAISRALGPALPQAALPAPDRTGIALWLSDRPGRQRLLVSSGLPGPDDFSRMFGSAGPDPADPTSSSWPGIDAAAGLVAGSREASPMAERQFIPEDTDLLALFEPSAATATATATNTVATEANADAKADPDPDAGATRPGNQDILALFDVQPDSDKALKEDAKPAEPDILDLFGASATDKGKVL